MNRLALRMLFGDRAKYLMLVSGITFATLLMANSASLFCGMMSWTFSTMRNVRAPIWVADPKLEQIMENKPLRDTDVNRVRSVPGVGWAVPLFQTTTQARLLDGTFQIITLVGIDPTSLIGAPTEITAGRLEDLRMPNTIMIDEWGIQRLADVTHHKVGLGDVFEINDSEARIVGIFRGARAFGGGPYVITTYDRAVTDYVPAQRKLLTFVLAAPRPGHSVDEVAAAIEESTGLKAFTERAFMWSTIWWFVANTGIPINIGLLVVIGFLVGTIISGQTFYSFVIENTRNLAAFKAMGTSNLRICVMLVIQSMTVGLIGYGIGLGLVTLIGNFSVRTGKLPFLMLWQIPAAVLAAVLFICSAAAVLGILRIARVDPASVFR